MRLATYTIGGRCGVGVVVDDGLIPAERVASYMQDIIVNWDRLEDDLRTLASARHEVIALDRLVLNAPLSRPGKILAIGLNYKDHIAETGAATPQQQLWFAKQLTCVNDPFAPIEVPRVATGTVDYEAELVAVIGRRGRHISREAAPAHVFGYCCGNDVSVREWQRHTPQWMLGKSFDTHGPIGPWIVTADEVGDPHRLDIRCLVNGEIRQRSNTRHLLFNVWDQIAHVSEAMTLEPGDLFFTGTPGGVGAAMKPPGFLAPGDRVAVEIEGIGRIEGLMVAEN